LKSTAGNPFIPKEMKKHTLTALFLLLTLALVLITLRPFVHPSRSGDTWLIDSSKSAGYITPTSTIKDIMKAYGPEHTQPWSVPIGEGEVVAGTRVLGGSKNEVLIEWKSSGTPERITIASLGTDWKTPEGISIGSTIESAEKANGAPFKITGFEWDYPARTVSWEGGHLSDKLQMDFEYSDSLSQKLSQQIPVGEGSFSSSLPSIKAMGLKVSRIFVIW
jgi:hypothetical protein